MTDTQVLAAIEAKHGVGVEGLPQAFTKPSGQGTPYIVIYGSGIKEEGAAAKGGKPTIDAAAAVFLKAFDEYAAKHSGKRIVWRSRPEHRVHDGEHYFRARFCFEAP